MPIEFAYKPYKVYGFNKKKQQWESLGEVREISKTRAIVKAKAKLGNRKSQFSSFAIGAQRLNPMKGKKKNSIFGKLFGRKKKPAPKISAVTRERLLGGGDFIDRRPDALAYKRAVINLQVARAKSLGKKLGYRARHIQDDLANQRAFAKKSNPLTTRSRAAAKAAKLKSKAKKLEAYSKRPTIRQRVKSKVAKKAHGLVSRVLGNPAQRLPKRGEVITITAHGKTATLAKNASGSDYNFKLTGDSRVRFGNAKEIREDVANFKAYGTHPPAGKSPGWGTINPSQSQRGAGSTRSEVRSPTKTEVRSPTSTSTHAHTAGNFTATVTGGAGAGATNVKIYTRGKKGNPKRRNSNVMRARGAVVASSNPRKGKRGTKATRRTKGTGRKNLSPTVSKSPRRPSRNPGVDFLLYPAGAAIVSAVTKKRRNRKRNSSPQARTKQLREKFTGKPSTKTVDVLVPDEAPRHVVRLGRLLKLDTDKGVINFSEQHAPYLVSDAAGKRFFIAKTKGNPARFAAPGDYGHIRKIEYREDKRHISKDPKTIYFHKTGEESGSRPRLVVDKNGCGHIRGGRMYVTAEGIRD